MALIGLADAIELAVKAHSNQFDKAGESYILHPLRVMVAAMADPLLGDSEEAHMAAVLHDVVEDTPITLEDIADQGASPLVFSLVNAMTRREEEDYESYIWRVHAGGSLARRLKILDIKDNTSLHRMGRLPESTQTRLLRKYQRAIEMLES